jgi:protein O-GlcNAc transferase
MAKSNERSTANASNMPVAEIDQMFAQAISFHRAGLLSEAGELYQRILKAQPHHFDSMHLIGVVHTQRGDYAKAVRQIQDALKIGPNVADAHNNLGNALKKLGRLEEALASYKRAIALKPDDALSLNNRGTVLKDLERYNEALADFDRAIYLKPDFAEAFNNRGNVLLALERAEEALSSYDRSIALRPNNADAHNNRGNALHQLDRLEEALASYDGAIALKPEFAEAHYNRGLVLGRMHRLDEALLCYERATGIKPDHADAFNNWANTLKDLRRFEDALEKYGRAIALKPKNAEYLNNNALLLADLDRFDEALVLFDRAIALDPNINHLQGMRFQAKMQVCDWTYFDWQCAQLHDGLARGAGTSHPFQSLICATSPQDQLKSAQIAVKCDALPPALWNGERYAHDRIRLAYASSDFSEHPVASLTAGMFERHDRTRFETIALSFRADNSAMRARLRAAFDRFVDAETMTDVDLAKFIRQQEIDILVDLNGFTRGERSHIFAHRPAPIQVNYLGYAATLGASAWDYIIADRFVIPEATRSDFAEAVVYLPNTYMVTDSGRGVSPSRPSRAGAGLPERGFVFCCFNNSFKITPDVFDVWMRLLQQVDGSVLWLAAVNPSAVGNLRREAGKRGIAGDRLISATRVASAEEHLARLGLADLFLDTRYYNAHATAADALWAGVPVLTCAGATFASRVAGSLLSAVGLPELITHSLKDYEALALTLACEPDLLASIRQKLAENRLGAPLFDTERYTRHIEAAFTTMWERHQRGEGPQGFAVN